jgi:hypothetical protein
VLWKTDERLQRKVKNGAKWIKKMGSREVGRHRRSQKGRKVPTLREIKRVEAQISEVRSTSQGKVDERIAEKIRRQKKTRSRKHRAKANQRQNICKKQIKKDKTKLCREHPTNSRLKPKSISGPRRVVRE